MKKVIFCFLFTVIAIHGAIIFGPATYFRTTGAPNVYDTTFTAYDTTVTCTLVVINGDADGEHRLSSASIEFNGEEIVKERDFSESVETITRVLQLRSENSLHLRLRSGPGDFLTLNVHRPCDAFVSLVVDTVIDGEACFSATATGWGALSYSWDFDGDGETDTTTAENVICHTYETADTYLAAVKVTDEAGCTATDNAEVIIELGYHYTFQIDSSYTPWSYSFPASDSILIPAAISDDGSTVVFASYFSDNSYESYHKDFYVFVAGTLALKIEEIHRVIVNHAGDKVGVELNPVWIYTDYDPEAPAQGDYCLSLNGDTLWSQNIFGVIGLSETIWSLDDSYWASFGGAGILDKMPYHYNVLGNWQVDYFPYDGIRIYDSSGVKIMDTLFHKHNYIEFKNDLSGFIIYKTKYNIGIWDNDTIEVFGIDDGYPHLKVKFASPIEYHHKRQTCINAKWADFDNRIYISWGFTNASDPWDQEYAIQYYCLDTLGNVIWSDVDTSTMSGKLYSKSGKYLAEYDRINENTPAGVIFRETATNEILFEKYYSDTHLNDVEIWEHEETGNALIMIPERNGPSKIFYPDGTRTDFNPLGIIPCFDYNFGYKVEGNTLTFYKVRW